MKQPKNPFHPGEILLEEFLTPAGITQTAFAKKLGWNPRSSQRAYQGQARYHGRSRVGPGQGVGNLSKALDELAGHL